MFKFAKTLLSATALCVMVAGCNNKPSPDNGVNNPAGEQKYFVSFESGAVRPIAKSNDGKFVYMTNTPNHSLDVFEYDAFDRLAPKHSIPVGVEPVAVAVAGNGDVWVVNHISDSISIVKFDRDIPYINRTLLVGDEPRDIVFANDRAFITTAHRGQHRSHPSIADVPGAGDPNLHTPSTPRADIWVFNSNQLGESLGGDPVQIIELFGDTPRALAVTPDEQTVYAAVFYSGNQTSVVHEAVLCYGFDDDVFGSQPCNTMDGIRSPNGLKNGQLPGGRAGPGVNKDGVPQPWASMIVKYDEEKQQWLDTQGRNFSNGIRFSLPDNDVFAIDASTLNQKSVFQHVGTTLFNMAVNPINGNLYVTNTEANNATRFEGPGITGGSTVQGNIAKSRITVIQPNANTVYPRPLNRHIDYRALKAPTDVKQHSIANPTQIAVSKNGKTLYVAALGSNKVAVYNTDELENSNLWDNIGPEFDAAASSDNHISITGGPVGIALNEAKQQLITYTRFDNSLVVTDLITKTELQRINLTTPETHNLIAGRPFLYDAERSSSNGEASCASCHVFGDTDHLSWNLGNPDASNTLNPQPFPTFKFSSLGCDFVGPDEPSCSLLEVINGDGNRKTIASMKGPMFTQTLRGMSTHGHLHWRGDRSVGYFGNDTEQTLDEKTSFKNFIVAFEGLLGLDIALPESVNGNNKSPDVLALEHDIDQFADFMLSVQMPPNPIRGLDNALSESAKIGRNFFLGARRSDGLASDSHANGPEPDGVNCEGCHGLDAAEGFFGTRGEVAHGGEIQILKVPQLRNLYTRVGMFGLPDRDGFLPSHTRRHQGDQIRGFGFLHDGATDQLLNFLKGGVFDNGEEPCSQDLTSDHGCELNAGLVGIPNETVRQGLVDFMMEFESDIAPIVGQQITLSEQSNTAHHNRLDLLEQRAATPFASKILGSNITECDLIAKGIINHQAVSYLYDHNTTVYQPDSKLGQKLSSRKIRELALNKSNTVTFTCLVPGAGVQMALDANLNGIYNQDEVVE